jgi:hypothetical protein
MDEMQDMIATMVRDTIREQLLRSRIHRTFGGAQKATSGLYGPYNSPPFASGSLYDSVNVFWETDTETGEANLIVEMADHYYWVEFGRKPGRFPNLQAIFDWMDNKPIRPWPGISRDSQAYLIGRSIQREGWQGTKFLENSEQMILDKLSGPDGPVAEMAFNYLSDLIDQGRLIPRSSYTIE